MRNSWTVGLAAMLLIGGAVCPAFAETNDAQELSAPDVAGIQRKVAPGEVVLNGKTLFTVPVGAGNLTAAERADVIRERLEEIAAHYADASGAVAVAQTGTDTFTITVAGETVASVEPRLARAVGAKSPAHLAEAWAQTLRGSLAQTAAMQVSIR